MHNHFWGDCGVCLDSLGLVDEYFFTVETLLLRGCAAQIANVQYFDVTGCVTQRGCELIKKLVSTISVVVVQMVCQSQGLADTLPELIEQMLLSHPSVRSQQAQGRSAQEALDIAVWQYFPTPSLGFEGVNASKTDLSNTGDDRVTTFRLQQPLWSVGRLDAGVGKAKAGILSAQASLGAARQDLALRAVQYYSDLVSANGKVVSSENNLQTHERLRQQIVRRIDAGISPQSDLMLVMHRVEQTNAELAVSRAQKAMALAHLSQLVGKSLSGTTTGVVPKNLPALNESVERLIEQVQANTASIDQNLELHVLNTLRQTLRPTDRLVLVTHKAELLPAVDRLIVIVNHQIQIDGPRDQVLARLQAVPLTVHSRCALPATPTIAALS